MADDLTVADGFSLLWTILIHLTLTAAPGIAATLLAARRGVREVPVLLVIGLVASGVAAMLAFWSYLPAPFLGHTVAYGIFFGSLALIAWAAPALRGEGKLLRRLAVPLGLWALSAVFLLYLGFLHGGLEGPLGTAATRFSGQLPSDNDIPNYFAGWFFSNGFGEGPPVYPGDWLSSDRPPLQMGYVLMQRIFAWDDSYVHYQVVGVLIQQLWVIGMWALLCVSRLGWQTRSLVMAAALISDVAIVHGFYVWPKLLSTAFVLGAATLVLSPRWAELRRDTRVGALLAALAALALLSHGGGLFGLVPLALFAAYRGMPDWRWLGVGVLVGALLIAPWSAYQRYGDPPGNRLLKWHLGGSIELDSRGTLETISDSYREAGLGGFVDNKIRNLEAITGTSAPPGSSLGDTAEAIVDGQVEESVRGLRNVRFFNLLPFLGLFLLAPFAMVIARERGRSRTEEWEFAVKSLSVVAIGCVAWALIMFGAPDSMAWIGHGSLAIPLLAVAGLVAGLRATYRRFAAALVGINSLIVLAIYVPALDPPPNSSYSLFAAVAAAVSLAGVLWLLFGIEGDDDAGSDAGAPNTLAR